MTGGMSPVMVGSGSADESDSALASSLCVLGDVANEGVVVDGERMGRDRGWERENDSSRERLMGRSILGIDLTIRDRFGHHLQPRMHGDRALIP